ncbi:MAG: hypothetical protein DRP45_00695 [Candidatus Zixiibacteriota bacterium]|nr:MAG: hypothetical protein DRP45_00695 [candidate division Zixibacteria bacterium]
MSENVILIRRALLYILLLCASLVCFEICGALEKQPGVPVQKVPAAVELSIVPNSFAPDSVYAGVPFDISFDILTTDFSGPIDSAVLTVDLLSATDSVVATVFNGVAEHEFFNSGVIRYSSVESLIDSALNLSPEEYNVRLYYRLYSESNVFPLDDSAAGSIIVLQKASLEYVGGSFIPVSVPPGLNAIFECDITLIGDSVVLVDNIQSYFHIAGQGFSALTELAISGDSLIPGTNHIMSEPVAIPAGQLGDSLSVDLTVVYRHHGAANALTYTTTFDDLLIAVVEMPVIQLDSVSISSFNAPNVNSGQEFDVKCWISNVSTLDQPPFDIRMTSDGSSLFVSDRSVPEIVAGEDTEILFDVLAVLDSVNPVEIFEIEVITPDVLQAEPLDDNAVVIIEEPAVLALTHFLDVEQGYLNRGQEFRLLLQIWNAGGSNATNARYELTSGGIDLGIEDPLVEMIGVMVPRGIVLQAPDYDTTITITLTLVDIPTDVNTGQRALIGDTTFEEILIVQSQDMELLVGAELTASSLVLPDGQKELFQLNVNNITDYVRLDSVSITFADKDGHPLNAQSVLNVATAGLYRNDTLWTEAVTQGDRLTMCFCDSLEADWTEGNLSLVFRAAVLASAGNEFRIGLKASDLVARYSDGPPSVINQPVTVTTADGSDVVLGAVYTTAKATLGGSFTIRYNPCNPVLERAEFQFYLDRPSGFEFRMLTLTGEEVYSRDYVAGTTGPDQGLQTVLWNGHNDEGFVVVNGVYIAVITVLETGEQARLKVAVLK